MIKDFFSALFTIITISSSAQVFQEKIIDTPDSDQTFGAVEVNGELFIGLSRTNIYFGSTVKSIIYHADKNLNIIDSLDLTYHNGADYFNIHNILEASDSTFWVLGNSHYSQSGASSTHAILVDRNLLIVKDFKYSPSPGNGVDILNLCVLDSFVVASGNQQPPFIPVYLVWDKYGNMIHSKLLDTIGGGGMSAIYNHEGRLLYGLSFIAFYSRGEINVSDFSIDTIIKDKPFITNNGFLNISGFCRPDSLESEATYCYGLQFGAFFWCRLDSNLQIMDLDTFTTSHGKGTLVDRGMLDAWGRDHIYFVTAEDLTTSHTDLKPGLSNKMKLWRIKKNGDVVWSVLINDSSYYLPTKTVATSDGGAVFFSMKYDWRIDPQPKTSLSIIKLDSTGNFVGLTEIEMPYQNLGINVYPNPFTNRITLSGIDTREISSATIYDVSGKVLSEIRQPESLDFDTFSFLPGTYFLQVVLNSGQSGVYKVVKR